MSIVAVTVIGLSSVARSATIPDYVFFGPIAYSGGVLSVGPGSTLISSQGLPAPFAVTPSGPGSNVPGSEIVMSLNLVPGSVVDDGSQTLASFTSSMDASIFLGNGSGATQATPVLTGFLTGMQVAGGDGNTAGILTGFLHPTGGSAIAYFSNPSDVIALQFDLSTEFSSTMYDSPFTGDIDGKVVSTAVPLPAALPLLLSGIGVVGVAARRRRQSLAAVS
jgi:PEP-CTERM motif-containing protein